MKAELQGYVALRGKLKEAADRKLTFRVNAALRSVAKPIGEEVVQEGADAMPSRGGLRAHLKANGKVSVGVLAKRVELRLQDRKGIQLAKLNGGVLRHPLFKNKKVWFRQSVPAETYDRAFLARKDDAVRAVADAVTTTMKELG